MGEFEFWVPTIRVSIVNKSCQWNVVRYLQQRYTRKVNSCLDLSDFCPHKANFSIVFLFADGET